MGFKFEGLELLEFCLKHLVVNLAATFTYGVDLAAVIVGSASHGRCVDLLELLAAQDVEPTEEIRVLPEYLLVLLQSNRIIPVNINGIEDAFDGLGINSGGLPLKTVPVRHEFFHDEVHLLEVDFAFAVHVEEAEAELVFLVN